MHGIWSQNQLKYIWLCCVVYGRFNYCVDVKLPDCYWIIQSIIWKCCVMHNYNTTGSINDNESIARIQIAEKCIMCSFRATLMGYGCCYQNSVKAHSRLIAFFFCFEHSFDIQLIKHWHIMNSTFLWHFLFGGK